MQETTNGEAADFPSKEVPPSLAGWISIPGIQITQVCRVHFYFSHDCRHVSATHISCGRTSNGFLHTGTKLELAIWTRRAALEKSCRPPFSLRLPTAAHLVNISRPEETRRGTCPENIASRAGSSFFVSDCARSELLRFCLALGACASLLCRDDRSADSRRRFMKVVNKTAIQDGAAGRDAERRQVPPQPKWLGSRAFERRYVAARLVSRRPTASARWRLETSWSFSVCRSRRRPLLSELCCPVLVQVCMHTKSLIASHLSMEVFMSARFAVRPVLPSVQIRPSCRSKWESH